MLLLSPERITPKKGCAQGAAPPAHTLFSGASLSGGGIKREACYEHLHTQGTP